MNKLKVRLTLSALTLASFVIPLVALTGSEKIKHVVLGGEPNLETPSIWALPSDTQMRAVKSPLPAVAPQKNISPKPSTLTPQLTPPPAHIIIIPRASTQTRTS